jgi:xanthine dehydrogenase accessory factor
MRLLVLEDGTFLGTVGGGCLEAEVYDAALEVIKEELPRTIKFRLTESDAFDSGLLCGGEVSIFIEPVTTPSLWIFGGGHISKALVTMASMAGFRVTVCDDRERYASPERFPDAAEVLALEMGTSVERMPLGASSYVVVATRGHAQDGQVLAAMARRLETASAPRFLGMIGSKTKKAVLFRQLREEGVSEDFLARVRSPVGLCLGGRSHEEIAVAIVGELISVRRLGVDADQAWLDRKRSDIPRAKTSEGGSGTAMDAAG